jgi:hypothetical protein
MNRGEHYARTHGFDKCFFLNFACLFFSSPFSTHYEPPPEIKLQPRLGAAKLFLSIQFCVLGKKLKREKHTTKGA